MRVPGGRIGGQVQVPNTDAAGFCGQANALLHLHQGLLRLATHRDVLERPHQPHGLSVFRLHRAQGVHPEVRAIAAHKRQFQVKPGAASHGFLHGGLDGVAGLGRVKLNGTRHAGRVAGLNAVNAAGLVGPMHFAGHQVQLPTAHPGQGAGAVQQSLAFEQRLFVQLLHPRGPPSLQRPGRSHSQIAHDLALLVVQLAWLAVNHAQGANAVTVAQHNGLTGIKTNIGLRGHQRVVIKARVLRGVRHLKQLVIQNGVGAKRQVTGRFMHPRQANIGLEPLALGVNQADERNGHPAHQRGHPDQRIKLGFGRTVQHIQLLECRQAGRLIGRQRG